MQRPNEPFEIDPVLEAALDKALAVGKTPADLADRIFAQTVELLPCSPMDQLLHESLQVSSSTQTQTQTLKQTIDHILTQTSGRLPSDKNILGQIFPTITRPNTWALAAMFILTASIVIAFYSSNLTITPSVQTHVAINSQAASRETSLNHAQQTIALTNPISSMNQADKIDQIDQSIELLSAQIDQVADAHSLYDTSYRNIAQSLINLEYDLSETSQSIAF